MTATSLSLAPDFDESAPPVTAFAADIRRTTDQRSDERAIRVDGTLVMPESTKLQSRDSNVSVVPPVRSEREARTFDDEAHEVFDEALLDVLAAADLARYASVFEN